MASSNARNGEGQMSELDLKILDPAISVWIDKHKHRGEARWLVRYALAFNRLDATLLRDGLVSDVTYESQSVFETMHGSEAFLRYLEGKFKTIQSSNAFVVADLSTFPGGKPCVAMYQMGDNARKEWLDTPIAAMTVSVSPEGLAQSMLMITCVPPPASAKGSGLFPGHEINGVVSALPLLGKRL